MKKTLEVLNNLEKHRIIENYAIGGATALLFYTEPTLTFDLDIFIFLPGGDKTMSTIIDLDPLYTFLKSNGYHAEKEHVMIEGIPVQFIPIYNPLVKEAVEQATIKEYEGVPTKVLRIEYLLSIMIDTNRPKDRERIGKLLDEVDFDQNLLQSILKKHSLQERWSKISEKR